VFRLPLNAYRHNAGWMLGHTFLEFTHMGRKTGMPHEAVAMVLHHDTETGEAVICAAWGPRTDWYLNLRAHPAVIVRVGRESYRPLQRFLSEDEAFEVAVAFRRDHPHRLRVVGRVVGWGDVRDDDKVRALDRSHPFVAFRPTTPRSNSASAHAGRPGRNVVRGAESASSPDRA
jgi:deazaflavin-dependent oxidoreductase (nitroreductase family)